MSKDRILLALILVGYTLTASLYSILTPLFEVSDELWHYPMVKFIADNADLPVQDPANPGPWRQEGSQPPLYYMMGAALTFWIDTSDMDTVRRVNPHADIGIVRPDGNANMMVHRPELEAFPWRGTALAVHIVRFMSVLLGLGTVAVTYALAREIFPGWPTVALTAAALVAFMPMFVFIHGSVNNDALSNFIGNALTLQLVLMLKGAKPPHLRDYIALGIGVGVGLLAKGSLAFMIPMVAIVLGVLSVRNRDWRPFVYGGLISGALTNVIAGWWYIRNWMLYDDPTGLNTFLDTVGRRLIPANAAQLWAERHSFLQAYWGFFGGVNVPLPGWAYDVFNTVGLAALLSGVAYLLWIAFRRAKPRAWWLYTAVTIIWPVVTFASYLRWTHITPASQGRLVFGALSSIALWMAVGLAWPGRARRVLNALPASVGAFFVLTSVGGLFGVIRPTYTPPLPPSTVGEPQTVYAREGEPGELALLRAEVTSAEATPESYILLETAWQAVETPARDWSLFVHLTRPDGVIIGQRDVYPGRGLLATSELEGGRAWTNPIAVWVPEAAYAPSTLDVNIGWYHLPTGERLTDETGAETVTVGSVDLVPRAGDFPNPLSVNFASAAELVGYELSTLTPQQGEAVEMTLYWRALSTFDENYTIFVHIIDPGTADIVAGSDAQPAGWTRPTTTWEPGEIIADTHTMTVREDAAPMVYELEVGFYIPMPDGSFPRLRVVTDDGGMANDFFYLSRVRVQPDD